MSISPETADRRASLTRLADDLFDVLVIGGGITGAGVAREAALAGYRTALVERDDFAAGTSSRSSRLVHGGVRYLEHGHLGLVFESSHERRLLLQLAPHLVRPLAFTWPVYRGARVPRWKVRAGLLLYDALALFRNVQAHEGLNAAEVLEREPALTSEGLTGGARYWDAATNDTRLTLATALGAAASGAVLANHCAVEGAVHSANGRLAGVTVRDVLTDTTFAVRARVVVNATGPWSEATAALTGESQGTQVLGSAGTHIAVPRQRIGNHDAITMVSPLDGRVMFVLPSGPHAIVGTTEQPARRGPDEIRATETDVTYLLQSVNRMFPHAALTPDDVISAWCGIRPLAMTRAGAHSANSASREHAVLHRADGLVSVTGGKLTTYRAMAADVLAQARREFATSGSAPVPIHAPLPSASTPLPGGAFASRDALIAEARAATQDHAVAEHLVHAHGTQWQKVWRSTHHTSTDAGRLVETLPYTWAEVRYTVQHELACTLSDVLIRRTHVAFETRDHGRGAAERIAPLMASLLGWSDEERVAAVARYHADVTRLFAIDA
ncbi:glycerol-3-phosphate dehydrogenase/oxidase [Gemmatimonas phototrophica]|uniref:Glycerol-3-phosphate dehydrogenase n=1 Tax=Gemmatimonas phototrophica TaxID=1379270 RepID=A0A143BMU4_9BACT|nr:glycerol-3-phosphate dehydrogenase/oxidase [Gemmatimonas phototrophica]AMW05754.1 glycerol-3-phosphate dehydrogenase [Gemmatimonas phototrophica]